MGTQLLQLIPRGIAIGLGAAVPIGPVNVEIARRTLRGGFRAGFALGAGAVSVDVTYALLSCLSIGRFLTRPAVDWPLRVGGILFLTFLGVQCLRAAWTRRVVETADAPPSPRTSLRSGYFVGLVMTFLNPMTLLFWFVALPAMAGPITQDPARELPIVCMGVFVGTIGWVITFAGALAVAGRFRRERWLVVTDTIGGVTLLSFALATFLRSIHALL
jgi:L-lysine exporter family protein LysE/ArgO